MAEIRCVSVSNTFAPVGDEDGTVHLWDLTTNTVRVILHPDDTHSDAAFVAITADGTRLACGSSGGGVVISRTDEVTVPLKLAGHEEELCDMTWSPDGKFLVTGSADATARVWTGRSRCPMYTLQHDDPVFIVQVSPDSKLICTAAGTIASIWNAISGQLLRTLVGHAALIWSIRFSPDGHCIVTGSEDGTARIWSTDTGDELLIIQHEELISSVEFSPDGKEVVCTSNDGYVSIWNSFTGERYHLFDETQSAANVAAYSNSGALLATGSADGTVKLWNRTSGALLAQHTKHGEKVTHVRFACDDGYIVSLSQEDGAVYAWSLRDMGTFRPPSLVQ